MSFKRRVQVSKTLHNALPVALGIMLILCALFAFEHLALIPREFRDVVNVYLGLVFGFGCGVVGVWLCVSCASPISYRWVPVVHMTRVRPAAPVVSV